MTEDEILNNKKVWPDGPWQNEPDRVEWRYGGLPCLIVRNHMGALCGYVAVYNDHPWSREDYNDVEAEVHGGLTFAGRCNEHICHTPHEGDRDTEVWWLGFDCGHAGDVSPAMITILAEAHRRTRERFPQFDDIVGHLKEQLDDVPAWMRGDVYRDIEYVKAEVTRLANQALAAATLKGRVGHVKDKIRRKVQDAKWAIRSGIREAINPPPPAPPGLGLDQETLFRMKAMTRRLKGDD